MQVCILVCLCFVSLERFQGQSCLMLIQVFTCVHLPALSIQFCSLWQFAFPSLQSIRQLCRAKTDSGKVQRSLLPFALYCTCTTLISTQSFECDWWTDSTATSTQTPYKRVHFSNIIHFLLTLNSRVNEKKYLCDPVLHILAYQGSKEFLMSLMNLIIN